MVVAGSHLNMRSSHFEFGLELELELQRGIKGDVFDAGLYVYGPFKNSYPVFRTSYL